MKVNANMWCDAYKKKWCKEDNLPIFSVGGERVKVMERIVCVYACELR